MPPAPNGSPQQMAVAQYAYLFQMAQQLNLALGQLESGGTGAASGGGTSTHQGTARRESTGYQELKSLIVKTARLVKRQMEQLSARLEGEYVAVSDFGTYVEPAERLSGGKSGGADPVLQLLLGSAGQHRRRQRRLWTVQDGDGGLYPHRHRGL